MNNQEYYDLVVEEIIADLTANLRLKNFTKNSDLIGTFAEESINELIKKIVFPLRVSTGSVIDVANLNSDKELPQVDCIIWTPSPLPALFEKGNFGLIPRANSLGILEIKSSNYSAVGNAIEKVLKRENDLVDGAPPKARGTLPNITLTPDSDPKSLGVICLYDTSKSDSKLTELIDSEKVVTILKHNGDFNLVPSRKGVLKLIVFLATIRKRAFESEGKKSISIEHIEKEK